MENTIQKTEEWAMGLNAEKSEAKPHPADPKHETGQKGTELNGKKSAIKFREWLQRYGFGLRIPAIVAAGVYLTAQSAAAAVYLYLEGLATLVAAVVLIWLKPRTVADWLPPVEITIPQALVLAAFMAAGADLLLFANLLLAVVVQSQQGKAMKSRAEARVLALSLHLAAAQCVAAIHSSLSGIVAKEKAGEETA